MIGRSLLTNKELLWNFTLRELRTRYKRSALGWIWSLLNPLGTMLVFTIVFGEVLDVAAPLGDPSGLSSFPLYLLCGLLSWTFFSTSITTSMASLIGNAGLVRKVWFPREHLVLATVLSLLVSLGIEYSLLMVALLIVGNMVLPWIPVVVLVLVLLAIFSAGLSLMLAAANVYFRDLTYLWTIVAQIWFYATPIVYPMSLVPDSYRPYYALNPMTKFVTALRDLAYHLRMPTLGTLIYLLVVSLGMFVVGLTLFRRLSRRFAEEL